LLTLTTTPSSFSLICIIISFFIPFFFFNDTATTEIYTLSLHDALPIYFARSLADFTNLGVAHHAFDRILGRVSVPAVELDGKIRSEEHTSELQSRGHLVCRLLLEKKNLVGPKPDSHYRRDALQL